jgi:hypothetical protein
LLLAISTIDGKEFGSDNVAAVYTLETLEMEHCSKGSNERAMHGESTSGA